VRKHAAEIVADVVAGKVPLREGAKAARKRRPASQRKARPKKVKTLEEIVRDKFSRFMEAFPYQKRAEVRAILRKLI
jgi:hypothetical protein